MCVIPVYVHNNTCIPGPSPKAWSGRYGLRQSGTTTDPNIPLSTSVLPYRTLAGSRAGRWFWISAFANRVRTSRFPRSTRVL